MKASQHASNFKFAVDDAVKIYNLCSRNITNPHRYAERESRDQRKESNVISSHAQRPAESRASRAAVSPFQFLTVI